MALFSRVAELKDSELIAGLSNQLGYDTSNEKTSNRLSEILNNPDNCVFVVLDNENLIGWIHGFYSLKLESDSYIEIAGLVVDQYYRRQGVGRILISKVIEWCQLKKNNRIRVRCNVRRQDAHLFYSSMGFVEIKEQKIFDLVLD